MSQSGGRCSFDAIGIVDEELGPAAGLTRSSFARGYQLVDNLEVRDQQLERKGSNTTEGITVGVGQ